MYKIILLRRLILLMCYSCLQINIVSGYNIKVNQVNPFVYTVFYAVIYNAID